MRSWSGNSKHPHPTHRDHPYTRPCKEGNLKKAVDVPSPWNESVIGVPTVLPLPPNEDLKRLSTHNLLVHAALVAPRQREPIVCILNKRAEAENEETHIPCLSFADALACATLLPEMRNAVLTDVLAEHMDACCASELGFDAFLRAAHLMPALVSKVRDELVTAYYQPPKEITHGDTCQKLPTSFILAAWERFKDNAIFEPPNCTLPRQDTPSDNAACPHGFDITNRLFEGQVAPFETFCRCRFQQMVDETDQTVPPSL